MARPRKSIPSYRLHKASGQAVTTIAGRDIYLGKHGTDASREAYGRAILQAQSGGGTGRAAPPVTVAGMVASFWRHVEQEGRYVKNGQPTSERGCIALALRPLVALFGSRPAASFTPKDLQTVRAAMVKPADDATRLTRSSANKHVHRIRLVFRWATSEGIVPAAVWQALRSVEGLRRGRGDVLESEPVKPANLRGVVAVLRVAPPKIVALIRLGWLTGARPGELVQMRMGDINRTGPVWIYRPGSHKNEHRGQMREIAIGPRAQQVLSPFLSLLPTAWVFAGQRRGTHLDIHSYGLAVRKIRRGIGCPDWTPNQLRHSAATRIRKRFGIDAARTVLGHSDVTMTATYAEVDARSAAAVAAAIG